MSILIRKSKGTPDLSYHLKDQDLWHLRRYERFSTGAITALAYDPVLDIYACGLNDDEIHVYGRPSVHFVFSIPNDLHEAIAQIQIVPIPRKLLCIVKEKMIIWSLDGILVNKPITVIPLSDSTRFIGTSIHHSHAFIPHPEGLVQTFDLLHLEGSPTTIVPLPEVSEGVIMDLLQSERDLDTLIIATYDSIYSWKFSLHQSPHSFTLPDGGELRPVCLAFHPNEDIFVAGTIDGRLVFWSISEAIPLWVTTIAELLGKEVTEDTNEPVFKLIWTVETASGGGSSLILLGGSPAGQSRLTTLHFDTVPFASRDQLVAQSSITYDVARTAGLKDFILLSSSELILALDHNGTLIPFPSRNLEENNSASLKGLTVSKPFGLSPAILTGQVWSCSAKNQWFDEVAEEATGYLSTGGGIARPRLQAHGPDPRLSKYDPHRILVALHDDGIIRFYNISSKLLLSPDPLVASYPTPLAALNVDFNSLLAEPLVWASLGDASPSQISRLHFVAEPRELYIILETGNIFAYKYEEKAQSHRVSTPSDSKLIDLTSLIFNPGSFAPRFLLCCEEGSLVSFAVSEVGFSAVAYESGNVYILDMRGPRILHHYHHRKEKEGPVFNLKFAVCSLKEKQAKRLVLAVFHQSGFTSILSIVRNESTWTVAKEVTEIAAKKGLQNTLYCFLVDIWSGEDLTASSSALATLMAPNTPPVKQAKSTFAGDMYRLTVSQDTIRSDVGWDGSSIKAVHLGGIVSAELIRWKESSALVVFDEQSNIHILAIPGLQSLATLPAPSSPDLAFKNFQFVQGSLEFTAYNSTSFDLWTFATATKAALPEITLPVRSEQQQESQGIMSWLMGKGRMTGEEFDNLVGVPGRSERPPPAHEAAAAAAGSTKNAMEQTLAAAAERGEALSTLADKTEQLENAAQDWATQAKHLAEKQSKRRTFRF